MCSCIYSKNRVTHQRGCSDWLHVRLYGAAKSFASAAPRLWWQGIQSPPDLKHSPRINTGLWRLTPGLLYSLNAEIYMTPVKVAALPASASIHSLLLFLLPLAAFGVVQLHAASSAYIRPSLSSSLSLHPLTTASRCPLTPACLR